MTFPTDHNGGPPLAEKGGWVKISRDIIEHYIVGAGQPVEAADKNNGSFSRLESWLDLLMLANWTERKLDNQGVVTVLRPGQTLAGRAYLAKRWNWTEKTVRVWLGRLEKEMMITLFCESVRNSEQTKQGQAKGHTRNVLTICNWDKYQSVQVAEGPDLGQAQGHPGATQGPQKKKGRREEGKNYTSLGQSVCAEPDDAGVPEVAGLNGATSVIVADLANWLSPFTPDYGAAHKSLVDAVAIYGASAVRDGYAELKADFADNKVRALSHKAFYGYARTAKERLARSSKPAQRRGIDPDVLKAQNEMLRHEFGFDKE